MEFVWSETLPTEPGWYWYRRWRMSPARCVEVASDAKHGMMFDGWEVKFYDGQWAGPIPRPVEPEPPPMMHGDNCPCAACLLKRMKTSPRFQTLNEHQEPAP